jgi:hypothetical protein
MTATLKHKTNFELGKFYRVRKPTQFKAPMPSLLIWTPKMDCYNGKIFKCKRVFLDGKHAALAVEGNARILMHIDWVEGPYSELIAKREEIADNFRATVLPNGDGLVCVIEKADRKSYKISKYDRAEDKLAKQPGSNKECVNDEFFLKDKNGNTQFQNKFTGDIVKQEKDVEMANINQSGVTTNKKSPQIKIEIRTHPNSERAKTESVVVNGLLYPNGVRNQLSPGDDVWFPTDRPDALGLVKIKDELESLLKENHRILDEVEFATKRSIENAPKDLCESLKAIDRKHDNEIDRIWNDFRKRQTYRTEIAERTMNELEEAFPPKRSYRCIRWSVGLVSLIAGIGSAVYFLWV